MKYTSITIENFRGISHLELTDLKGFNLIVGRNNCGKTSVLEAMFLLAGMANPQLVVSINGSRGMTPSIEDDFSSLFKNLKTHNSIQLRGRIDTESGDRRMSITPSYSMNTAPFGVGTSMTERNFGLQSTSVIPSIEGVNFDFFTHNNEEFHSVYNIKNGKILIPENYRDELLCAYLNPSNTSNINTAAKMDSLIINKKLPAIISVLKSIDPAIQNISMGSKNIYVDIGTAQMVPLNVMGDGLRKILDLLVSVAATKNGVLLIDEIENGLHYSSLSILWKAIFTACKEYNVQIIATTHSYECVENFSKLYSSFAPDGDDIRLIRISKDGDKHKAYSSNAEILRAGIGKEFEVR